MQSEPGADPNPRCCRLETFDRPIKQEPEHFANKKGALIGEFENYLGILKAVHSGADLQAAAKNAGGQLPGAAKGHLGYVLASRGSTQVCTALLFVTFFDVAVTGFRVGSVRPACFEDIVLM